MNRCVALVFILLITTSAHAAPPSWLRVAVAGAVAADTATTLRCLQQPTCTEANPVMRWAMVRPPVAIAVTGAVIVVQDYGLSRFGRTHPKSATILAWVIIGCRSVAAWHAVTIIRHQRR